MRTVAKAARVTFLARAQAAEPSSSQIFLLENNVVMSLCCPIAATRLRGGRMMPFVMYALPAYLPSPYC